MQVTIRHKFEDQDTRREYTADVTVNVSGGCHGTREYPGEGPEAKVVSVELQEVVIYDELAGELGLELLLVGDNAKDFRERTERWLAKLFQLDLDADAKLGIGLYAKACDLASAARHEPAGL